RRDTSQGPRPAGGAGRRWGASWCQGPAFTQCTARVNIMTVKRRRSEISAALFGTFFSCPQVPRLSPVETVRIPPEGGSVLLGRVLEQKAAFLDRTIQKNRRRRAWQRPPPR